MRELYRTANTAMMDTLALSDGLCRQYKRVSGTFVRSLQDADREKFFELK